MSVQIGINPLTWSNDDMPELGSNNSLNQCLQETQLAGFSGIELGNKFPREASSLRNLLDNYDLKLISGWYSSNLLNRSAEQEIAHMQNHMQLLKALDCQVVIFAETTHATHQDKSCPLFYKPTLSLNQRLEYYEKLAQVAKYLTQNNLQLAFHHHMGTYIQNFDEIVDLINHTPDDVGLLLDTGHCYCAGIDIPQLIKLIHHRIKHIHLKDVRLDILHKSLTSQASFLDSVIQGVFTMPGDGSIDFEEIFKLISQYQYKGWLVAEAEQDPEKAHPLTYAKLGFDNISKWVANYF